MSKQMPIDIATKIIVENPDVFHNTPKTKILILQAMRIYAEQIIESIQVDKEYDEDAERTENPVIARNH